MQDIIREEETVVKFRCLKCGYSTPTEMLIKEHVKTHKQPTCSHVNRWYSFLQEDDGEHKLQCQCKDCNLVVSVHLYTFDQTVLAKLFEDLGGESALHQRTHELMDKRKAWFDARQKFHAKFGRPMNEYEITMFRPEGVL